MCSFTMGKNLFRNAALVACLLTTALPAFSAEDAFLVRDILSGTGSSTPTGQTVLGTKAYFSAAASGTNTELWMSDGTNAGTVLVREIQAGGTGSAPSNFAATSTFVFFVANDGSSGAEPYASNGTVGSGTLLMNIRPGGTGSTVANQTAAGTRVYFTANDNSTGIELYVTDGTPAGTLRPRDIRTGAGNSSTPLLLTPLGNSVVFEATDGTNGIEPWVSDGTLAGTIQLANLASGGASSNPTSMEVVPALGFVFFDADAAGSIGRELYRTNGTAAGTVLVSNINSAGNDANPTNLSSALGLLFFSADSGGNGIEPYVTNGTGAGTIQISNISSGGGDSNPYGFTEAGTLVYFAADGSNGIELYKSHGTTGGTALVEDIRSGGQDSTPANFTAFGTKLFFTANDGGGVEPWISDGTAAGTFELGDINSGNGSSNPGNIVVTPTYVYFTADDNGSTGIEWWRTDGTTTGTIQVHDIRGGGNDAAVSGAVTTNGYVLFSASNGTGGGQSGQELWGIEYTFPTAVSIVRASADPTNAATVNFTVTFSEGVSGVNAGDFAFTTTGSMAGMSIASVTPVSTTVYTVTVNTGTGAGTLRLDIDDNDSIQDLQGSNNPLGNTGVVNGDFTSGQSYTVDRQAPSVASIVLLDPNPTVAASVDYSVTISENVTGVNAADFSLTTAGITGAAITGVVQNTPSNYTVSVSTGIGGGTIRLDVTDNDSIIDGFSNPLGGAGAGNGSYTAGPSYNIDLVPPSVSTITRADANPTNAASVGFTVTFSENVTGVTTGDFALTTTGIGGASVSSVTPVSASVYTVAVNTGSGSGTVRLDVVDDDTILDLVGNRLGGLGAGTGNFNAGQVYTIDKVTPGVQSIVRAATNPTNAASVTFTVTFSEDVTGVNNGDFTLSTSGVAGASVSGTVQNTPNIYSVTVNTGTGSGTVRLDITDNDSIQDAAGNRLGGTGNGNGNFNAGEVYTIDKTGPAALSIVRAAASPTNAASIPFTVTFSENATGVNGADFNLTTTGVAGASVGSVSQVTPDVYTVNVNSGTGTGTVRLNFNDNDSVIDALGNPSGGAGAGNGNFSAGEVYTIDRTGPTVSTINRLDTNPTSAAVVDYEVTFSESVTGVNAGDFTFTLTGGVAGASVANVTENTPSTYTVAVNTGTGAGTLRLNFTDNDSVVDGLGNVAGGAGAGNANFTTGQVYTIDRTAPGVSTITRADANPTNLASVDFTVTFTENVTGVDTADFALNITGLTGTSVTSVTPVSGTVYTVAVSTGSGSGTLRLDVADNDTIADTASNLLGGAGAGNGNFTGGQSYTVDNEPPSVLSIVRAGANPTNAADVSFTVTFSENVTGVNNTDFSLTTGLSGTGITSTTQNTPSTYTVLVDAGTGSGTLRLNVIDNDSIRDTLTNRLGGNGNGNGNFTSGESYDIDRTAPTVLSINCDDPNPTSAAVVSFTVTFSEAVTGVNNGDFALQVSGVTGATIGTTTPITTSTYTVTVNTGTGAGTIRLNLNDNDSIRDLATNFLGGSGSGNGNFTGQQYTVDTNFPTVTSINRVEANPTNLASVNYLVTFSENVTGVNAGDFSVSAVTVAGATISNVSQNTPSTYTVTVSTGTGDGTLRLDFIDNDSVKDTSGNATGGTGPNNGNFTTGQSYTVDKTSPTATFVMPDPNPTRSNKVDFTLSFSESVGTSFDETDVAVYGSTGIGGRTSVSVTGSGAIYNVEVKIVAGNIDGIIGITIGSNVFDLAGNPFGGASSPETYTVDNTPPTAIVTLTDPNPTNLNAVHFNVLFSELVGTTFGNGDVTVAGTLAGGATKSVSGSDPNYTVTITPSNPNADGTIDIIIGTNVKDIAGNNFEGAASPTSYIIDNSFPMVSSIVRADANPTIAPTVNFTVMFSEDVSGVGTGDFVLTTTGVSGASIVSRTVLTPNTYTITVNTGSGSGTIRLDLDDNDSIDDISGNPLGGAGLGNGIFTTGEVYNIDHTPPTVQSIVRANANPTNAATVQYTVTFNEDVTGVNAGDFDLVTTGVTGASVLSRTQLTPSTYTVSVSTGTGNGTVLLQLDDNDSIRDAVNNPLGGTGNGNGDFNGEIYTVDKTAPTVTAITRVGVNPTNSSTVQWDVELSEAVNGLVAADFTLVTVGVSGAFIDSIVANAPDSYRVTVATGTNNGTIRLNFVDNDTVTDLASNPIGGPGLGNGNFTGQQYTVQKNAPVVNSIVRTDTSPTNASSVGYTVTFSEPVTGVNAGDFALPTTGLTGLSVISVTQNTPSEYAVQVSTGAGSGSLRLDVIDNDSITDVTANPLGGIGLNNGNYMLGEVYLVDRTMPAVAEISRISLNPTNDATVSFSLMFTEDVTGVGLDDVALETIGVTGASIVSVTPVAADDYVVLVNTGSGDGTIEVVLNDNDSIVDDLNHPLGGVGAGNGNFDAGEAFTIDRTPPTVLIGNPAPGSTVNGPVYYTVAFIGADTVSLNNAMVTVSSTVTAAGTATVSGTGNAARQVVLNGISGEGTLAISIDAGAAIDAAGNVSVAVGPSATVEVTLTPSVPVNPWLLLGTMLAAFAAYSLVIRKRLRN